MTLYEYIRRNDRLDLLAEWDKEANCGLDPAELSASSKIKLSWVCKNGHHYEASAASRTLNGSGCPYCAGQKAIPGQTDLATMQPGLLKLWDSDRNGEAVGYTLNSHRKVWWKCRNGHEWQAKIFAVANGSGCPYCSGYYPIVGETDLATTHPQLAAEWDSERNGDDATGVSSGSSKEVWWRCELGHSYLAKVYSRVAGSGCPYCAGKKVFAGFNDLLTTDPKLCEQWDHEKNERKPTEINRGSHKKVWWKCELGHSYEAEPYARVAGNGCPYCAGRRVLPGFNDLATTNPGVAKQWVQDLNGTITPQMVTKGSNKKFWWKCSEEHYWQAAVFTRTRRKASDCPICAGKAKVRFEGRYKPDQRSNRAAASLVTQERPAV